MRDMEDKTALVVEDNTKHYERYAALLSGIGLRVERACDGIDALAMAKAGRYAVVILDINLPRLGGLEVLKAVRRTKPYLPIVVVSEFVGPAAEAECLNLGADDFISKSFHEKTFQARVGRAIWHGSLVGEGAMLRCGEVRVDDSTRTVFYDGKVVDLSEKEYNILLPLVKAHGRRVDPDVLEMAAWGDVKRTSKRSGEGFAELRWRSPCPSSWRRLRSATTVHARPRAESPARTSLTPTRRRSSTS